MYYSTEEIHAILCQVDRNTAIGRRDYLILVLAVQLGMRAGDIRQLKFENIKWSQNTVELVQQKTKNKNLFSSFYIGRYTWLCFRNCCSRKSWQNNFITKMAAHK